MKKPLVSVIMPTYNRAELIGDAINSVLLQTYDNFEFIIINDASNDNTEEVILKFVKLDDRIKYFKNEKNLYIARSLNRGIGLSRGEYIARIDDDDLWVDNQKLEKQINFLENNKEYVIVGTGNVAIYKKAGIKIKSLKPITDKEIRNNMLWGCPFLHPSTVFRRSGIEKLGGYNEAIKQAEDYDLWMRLGKIGKMYNFPEYSIQSLVGETNVGHCKRKEFIESNLLLIRKYRFDYPHFYISYMKSCFEYIDVSIPILRRVFGTIYKIRRFILNKFGKKLEIIKIK